MQWFLGETKLIKRIGCNSMPVSYTHLELKILHPLPRIDEITLEVDRDPRALYFKQARYGVFARMALILTLLKEDGCEAIRKGKDIGRRCKNPRCVTNMEPYLSPSFLSEKEEEYCEYCDAPMQ